MPGVGEDVRQELLVCVDGGGIEGFFELGKKNGGNRGGEICNLLI